MRVKLTPRPVRRRRHHPLQHRRFEHHDGFRRWLHNAEDLHCVGSDGRGTNQRDCPSSRFEIRGVTSRSVTAPESTAGGAGRAKPEPSASRSAGLQPRSHLPCRFWFGRDGHVPRRFGKTERSLPAELPTIRPLAVYSSDLGIAATGKLPEDRTFRTASKTASKRVRLSSKSDGPSMCKFY